VSADARSLLEEAGFTVAETRPDGTVVMDFPAGFDEPPTVRPQLVASRKAEPDAVELFGAILEAASDLRAAGETVYRGNLMGCQPTGNVLATARAAAERAIAVLDAYEAAL